MASILPSRLLGQVDGKFFVFDPRDPYDPHARKIGCFDIISYVWGEETPAYESGIDGVTWNVPISRDKLEDIKSLMVEAKVQYMWVDCVCINQADEEEKAVEIVKMFEYYKSARKCHILIHLPRVWNPQGIVDDLRFIDHILAHMGGAALASEANLTENLISRLEEWTNKKWTFTLEQSVVRSAAVELGVINCYSTCISHIISLFNNLYFSRVWTFQEMLLGKNITMWGKDNKKMSSIGELSTWMDLATDATDKAYKLKAWIEHCRVLKNQSVISVLGQIEADHMSLNSLQVQVAGISSARTDIINGGANWWRENHRGISNIFSAISITSRTCRDEGDIFRGLLGVFSGLFTPDEMRREMSGSDMQKLSFAFFKQLSIKTGTAWTRLAISSGKRGEWEWIPVLANPTKLTTTDCFAGVVNLGRLKQKGFAKTIAFTGIIGAPQKYMTILLKQRSGGYGFVFRGCNCGKTIKTGTFRAEPIPTHDQPIRIPKDETGKRLVQCATVLGSIMDPGCNIIEYRRRLLRKLQPKWNTSDSNAKPSGWIDRCVAGTDWENPNPDYLRPHNMSMHWEFLDIVGCESRLENENTSKISCEVRVNCGCTVITPFSLVMEAMTSVEGSSLGGAAMVLDRDQRIVLQDGMGLLQVGDVGKTFNLVAFGGSVSSHKAYAHGCRTTRKDRPVVARGPWPRGRALVREEFNHGFFDMMRDYGYVTTGGSGNLLICRNHPMDDYKIIGVCIDENIENKKGSQKVTIR